MDLRKIFGKKRAESIMLSKEEIADLLKVSEDALNAFEDAYKKQALDVIPEDAGIFDVNAKQVSAMSTEAVYDGSADSLVERIVNELLAQTSIYRYVDGDSSIDTRYSLPCENPVSLNEILRLDESQRPQLAGELMKKDITGNSYEALLFNYKQSLTAKDAKQRETFYHMFRQGLDILDLDPITYEIIGTNKNSMGYWLPSVVNAVKKHPFFKIPNTTVIKVPIPLLQLTRCDYGSLTPTTIKIVDEFCMKAFGLDVHKEYFIKTGTYSSKFDFRNAYVHGEKEVRELGEYLLFIHFQALQMASPLCNPCIYGVSTTNEWVVRDFIKDVENNPSIYKGLPLRTEYRVFVDFDDDTLLGISPYWKPDVMKQRFGHMEDADSPHQKHDYIIYLAHEEKLMAKYNQNKDMICEKIKEILPDVSLSGQWSIDIMQNGNDFYIIDMALAENSALKECVPPELLKHTVEDWIPKLPIAE